MKTQDDIRWTQQVLELHQTEAGVKFLEFYQFWFDAAEKMLEESWAIVSSDGDRQQNVMGAVREAMGLAESEFGFLSTDLLGQMLCVATMHWARGDEMVKQMTVIEHRVAEEALARKIVSLQEQAAETSDQTDDPDQRVRADD